jgi:hypothetical protein
MRYAIIIDSENTTPRVKNKKSGKRGGGNAKKSIEGKKKV